jgi:hypothetical protein
MAISGDGDDAYRRWVAKKAVGTLVSFYGAVVGFKDLEFSGVVYKLFSEYYGAI